MKIRNGFVSNSSSSSFILVFDNEILSINDLKQVFGTNFYCGYYDWYSQKLIPIPQDKIFESLFDKIRNHSEEELLELCADRYNKDFIIPNSITEPAREEDYYTYEEYEEGRIEIAKIRLNELKEHFKGKFIYLVEYSDNKDALERFMEHDFSFNLVPHIQISHH